MAVDRSIVRKIDGIVAGLLKKYPGGVRFFDALDATWRGEGAGAEVIEEYVMWFLSCVGERMLISTGRFGMFLHNMYGFVLDEDLFLVTGGLRSGAPMDRLDYIEGVLRGKECVLLDDSYYSGKTLSLIRAEVVRQGGSLTEAFVIYDGSPVKHPDVNSLYRYYDHYDPKPERKNPNVRRKMR